MSTLIPKTIVTFVIRAVFIYNNQSVFSDLYFSNEYSIKSVFIDYLTVLLLHLFVLLLK